MLQVRFRRKLPGENHRNDRFLVELVRSTSNDTKLENNGLAMENALEFLDACKHDLSANDLFYCHFKLLHEVCTHSTYVTK